MNQEGFRNHLGYLKNKNQIEYYEQMRKEVQIREHEEIQQENRLEQKSKKNSAQPGPKFQIEPQTQRKSNQNESVRAHSGLSTRDSVSNIRNWSPIRVSCCPISKGRRTRKRLWKSSNWERASATRISVRYLFTIHAITGLNVIHSG